MKIGAEVTVVKLSKTYGRHWNEVLGGYLKRQPTERNEGGRRKPARYIIVHELPTVEEFRVLLNKKFTYRVSDLVASVFCDVESLADELTEWYDNMPEGFQNSSKGEELQEAIDTLSGIDQVEVPEEYAEVEIISLPMYPTSRRERAEEAIDCLRTVAEAIQDYIDQSTDDVELDGSIIVDLNNAADTLEEVQFPGMY